VDASAARSASLQRPKSITHQTLIQPRPVAQEAQDAQADRSLRLRAVLPRGYPMKFITVSQLRSKTATIRKDLAEAKEIVLTANGTPLLDDSPRA